MIITTRNPSYLEPLGLFTVHTNVSTNARLSLKIVIGPRTIGLLN